MPLTPDQLRTALETRIAALVPINARLREGWYHAPIPPADWHGPASVGYDRRSAHLRVRVSEGEGALALAISSARLALANLDA